MNIPRAKITRHLEQLKPWEAELLETGRQVVAYTFECGNPTCTYRPDDWFSWGQCAQEAREHLRDAHGVRTVGSLTADDIGKWIELGSIDLVTGSGWSEMDGFRDQIVGIEHWDKRTKVRFENDRLHAPSSTPCRVTEERP